MVPATTPPATAQPPASVRSIDGSTRKVCQLTGDTDRQAGVPTGNQTDRRYGVWGTDLGASFEHDGRLVVLFGDTVGARPGDRDVLAFSDDVDPDDCVDLEFPTAADGAFRPFEVPGVSQGAFEVPTGGFSLGGAMYVTLFTGHPDETRSVLARSDDGGATFEVLHDVSAGRLRTVSPVRHGDGVFLFGSGEYRASDPYLAFLP